MMNNVLTNRLSPLIKYPGGKEKELNYIIADAPPIVKTKIVNKRLKPGKVGGHSLFFD